MKKLFLIFAITLAFSIVGFANAQTTCHALRNIETDGLVILEGNWPENCDSFTDWGVSFGQANYNCDENGQNCDTHAFICNGLCIDTGGNNDSCRKRTQGNPNKTGELSCGGSCRPGYQCAPNWPVKKDPKAGWCYCRKKNVSSPPATSPGSSIEPLASSEPTPTPAAPEITNFEITNFKLQQSSGGSEYYQCLKEQMAVEHPNYQLNLAWDVFGAETCTASCKYVKIDDYLANQDFDALTAQPWSCSQDIDGNTTFSGDVNNVSGTAKTKPRENGVIRYTLSCQSAGGSEEA